MIPVTAGAGFIGTNFLLDWPLSEHRRCPNPELES